MKRSKLNYFSFFCRGKGLGKEEDGRTAALLVTQKQDSKGIGFGTEGLFKPWWDDLYNSAAVSVKVKKDKKRKGEESRKDKVKKSASKDKAMTSKDKGKSKKTKDKKTSKKTKSKSK